MSNRLKYIAIEGVIGAGKTTLAKKLTDSLNAQLVLESFDDNPFLERFYENPRAYAFHTQIFFLLSRFKQLQELKQPNLFHEYIVADYIFEKDKIFAYLNLHDDELKLYETLTAAIEKSIIAPDLIIYLQSTTERLMNNIMYRNRTYEQNMQENYINDLNEAYNYFFFRYRNTKVMIVDTNEVDFINNEEDYKNLLNEILKKDHLSLSYFNPVSKREIKKD